MSFVSFALLTSLWSFSFFFVLLAAAKPLNPESPNLLFLVSDQQRFDLFHRVQSELKHYEGKLKVRTPHLDRLSREMGVFFRNAYTQCPVCAPARASLLSGCTVERTGVQTNELIRENVYTLMPYLFQDKIERLETMEHVLVNKYGYVAEYYGKRHLPDRLYYTYSGNTTTERVVNFNDYNFTNETFEFASGSWGRIYRDHLQEFERVGDIQKEFTDQFRQEDTYSHFPYEPIRVDSRYNSTPQTPLEENFTSFQRSQSSVCGRSSLAANYTPTGINARIAIKALDRLARQDRPFALTVSFHSPHPSMVPAWEHLEYYWNQRDLLLVPPNLHDPMNYSAYLKATELEKMREQGYHVPENVQEWTALYYALVEEIDNQVGALLQRLEDHGIENNTMVVFTSDHGELLGAHGYRGKGMFYEESNHIPLLMAFPGKITPGTVVNETVSHIDVVATILDYLGVAAQDDRSDGKILRPFIERTSFNDIGEEDFVVSEWDYRMPLDDSRLTRKIDSRPNFMVRKGKYKLILHKLATSSKVDMMYDLESDPHEVENLLVGDTNFTADDAIIGKAEHLRCLLLEWMKQKDGGIAGYFSDPVYNLYQGSGDIAEVQMRQSWRETNMWVSDTELVFGNAVWNGTHHVRNEYLYMGRRTEGSLQISNVQVEGTNSTHFSVDRDLANIFPGECFAIKVSYASAEPLLHDPFDDAYIRISHSEGTSDLEIPIRMATAGPAPPITFAEPTTVASNMTSSNEPQVSPFLV